MCKCNNHSLIVNFIATIDSPKFRRKKKVTQSQGYGAIGDEPTTINDEPAIVNETCKENQFDLGYENKVNEGDETNDSEVALDIHDEPEEVNGELSVANDTANKEKQHTHIGLYSHINDYNYEVPTSINGMSFSDVCPN